jgi:propionyl-CoA carboxylase alpha chain
LPDIGKLRRYVRPQGPGVRVDDGYEEGMDIPIFYDPMISKLIVWADNREAAMDRMIRAIDEYLIVGCETTLGFCRFVMQHEAFRSGRFDTHFVKHYFQPEFLKPALEPGEEKALAILAYTLQNSQVAAAGTEKHEAGGAVSHWKLNRS